MRKTKVYQQKFYSEWKTHPKLKDWIREELTNKTQAYCVYCKCNIQSKLSDLLSHAETKKHKSSCGPYRQIHKLPFKPSSFKTQEQESALALYISQHSAIAPIDHLSTLCKNKFNDSQTCIQMRLHRTKCTNVMKNVLAPHFIDDLRNDIGDSKFSLLLDESTDISITKLLGIVIIYFSEKNRKIVSTFLSMANLESGNTEGIVRCLKKELKQYKLNIKNLIGIGTDNASVMVGCNKSVYTELKKDVPDLILIRCVCHSVQLAINHACKQCLPAHLEFLIHETYNWFSMSFNRQSAYKQLYETINNSKEPLKITKVCDTRWLSIEIAVSRILDQWSELKTHFSIARNSEKCYIASTLYEMYKDNINYLYLLFLKPVLSELQILNKSFQSNTNDPTKLLNDLVMVIYSLKNKVIFDIITTDFDNYIDRTCYLGYRFENQIMEYKKDKTLDEKVEKNIRLRCTDFIVSLIKELKQRLPENYKILKKIDLFSVNNVLKTVKGDISPILTLETDHNIREKIVQQYQNINYIKWTNVTSTSLFWAEVHAYRDAGDNNPFGDLAKFALTLLSLPWSNADVERTFSQLNLVKSKIRNRLQNIMVNTILHIRYGLKRHDKCCYNYEIPISYIKLIGTSTAYNDKDDNVIDDTDFEDDEWIDIE
ncbi:hypothetical protein ALC57_17904 [Trachymyrmex cornetzi]|uniref:HAT C-terminal dimerisation domain-containing protein n=1 Tax=Trachymyrmex cornetzi TaxID=471704 RepID=A0A151ISR1_9HYME|nr:hypothetical protein ALC57_17904 [Trachymyrmex cornetzi]